MPHTPGPWSLANQPLDIVREEGGVFVYRQKVVIAVCDASRLLPPDEILANAQLITMAPEMLMVLHLLVDEHRAGIHGGSPGLLLARAAIATIEGH